MERVLKMFGGANRDPRALARGMGTALVVPLLALVLFVALWAGIAPRIETSNTHGTGCTLSSAIAARLAHGDALEDAIAAAKSYLSGALAASGELHVGSGHGPVHHFHALWKKGKTS